MITEAAKKELIDWISTLENQSMLEHLIELKNSNKTENIYHVSDLEREAIQKGLDDFKEGRVKSHEDVIKETKAKYPRFFE